MGTVPKVPASSKAEPAAPEDFQELLNVFRSMPEDKIPPIEPGPKNLERLRRAAKYNH